MGALNDRKTAGHHGRHGRHLLVARADARRPRGQARPPRAGEPDRVRSAPPGSDLDLQLPEQPGGRRSRPSPGTSDYFELSGTSMAAPMVAGAAALMLEQEPDAEPGDGQGAADAVGPKGERSAIPFATGAGALDILAALHATGQVADAPSPAGARRTPPRGQLALREHGRAVVEPRVLAARALVGRRAVVGGHVARRGPCCRRPASCCRIRRANALLWPEAMLWPEATLWPDSTLWSEAVLWPDDGGPRGARPWACWSRIPEPAHPCDRARPLNSSEDTWHYTRCR